MLVVDSSLRDRGRFPSPGRFEVALDAPVRDVVALRVVATDVPAPPTVGAHNRALRAAVAGAWRPAQLAPGDYASPADLAAALAAALTAAFQGAEQFDVALSEGALTVSLVGALGREFALAVDDGDAARLLGLPAGVHAAPTDAPLLFPRRPTLSPPLMFVRLGDWRNDGAHQAGGGENFAAPCLPGPRVHYDAPAVPLPRMAPTLRKFEVAVVTATGRPVDVADYTLALALDTAGAPTFPGARSVPGTI